MFWNKKSGNIKEIVLLPPPRLEFEFRGGLKWITGKIVQKKGKNGKKKRVKVVKYVPKIVPIKKWVSPACRAQKNV